MNFHLAQSWLSKPEPHFNKGSVEISFREGMIFLTAYLTQSCVMTRATAHQQCLWELGDVVECFIQGEGTTDYYEYQIAPNGLMLALHYPDSQAIVGVRNGELSIKEFFCDLPIMGNATISPFGWLATLAIPISTDQLRMNCSRYDYSSGATPIISSIAPLTKRDFHQVNEWCVVKIG